MYHSRDVFDQRLITKIDTDLRRFAGEWQSDPMIGAPQPIGAFCDLMMRGGKRLRGVLAVQSYYAHGGNDEKVALSAARVFEIIQTSLLSVDDIADRSQLRRGGLSVHAMLEMYATEHAMKGNSLHYGEAQGMNVAYAGLHKATTELLSLPVAAEATRRACLRFHENILMTINGQVDDMYNEATAEPVSKADVEGVLMKKTPYYTILGPIELGAQLAGVDELPQSLHDFSIHAGCAYQIADDIISTFGREDKTGKGNNDDIHEGKLTLLAYYALEHASASQTLQLEQTLGNENATSEECDATRAIFEATGALNYARERLRLHEDSALAALDKDTATNPQFVDYLKRLAEYLVNRQS